MEVAIAIAVTIGPLGLILALLLVSLRRRLHPDRLISRPKPWYGPMGGRGGGRAGDRSPTRPRGPVLSGGAALDVPFGDDVLDDEAIDPVRMAPAPPAPGRLAG